MPHVWQAFEWLENNYQLFSEYKSLIYVGHRHDTKMWWIDKFCKTLLKIEKIALIEIFQPNFEDAVKKLSSHKVTAFLGDVRLIDQFIQKGEYDIVFWDEGPEHVSLKEMRETTKKLKKISNCIIYSVPWGHWPQSGEGGNATEEHQYDAEPKHFEKLGMDVITFNQSGQNNSGAMIAYWRKKK